MKKIIKTYNKNMILDLAKKLQQNDLKDEGTLREIIQTLSKATGKNVSKEQEEKIPFRQKMTKWCNSIMCAFNRIPIKCPKCGTLMQLSIVVT